VLNVTLGGSLHQDIAKNLPLALDHAYVPARAMEIPVHPITVEPNSQLASVLGGHKFDVNSAHHQAVDKVGKGAKVVAQAPDGVIEAIELGQADFCIGVQWHPEAMVKTSETMLPLFANFVKTCMR
jgi:putative glutamine amidotransferase